MTRTFLEFSKDINLAEDDIINNNIDRLIPLVKEQVFTYCRFKPIHQIEVESGLYQISNDNKKLVILKNNLERNYTFTRIFDKATTQVDFFNQTAKDVIIDAMLENKSSLIFTYGITNSGKTYTMIGEPNDPGLLPNSLAYLIKKLNEIHYNNPNNMPQIYCNYVEVYNEEIFDLLRKKQKVQLKLKNKRYCLESKEFIYLITRRA